MLYRIDRYLQDTFDPSPDSFSIDAFLEESSLFGGGVPATGFAEVLDGFGHINTAVGKGRASGQATALYGASQLMHARGEGYPIAEEPQVAGYWPRPISIPGEGRAGVVRSAGHLLIARTQARGTGYAGMLSQGGRISSAVGIGGDARKKGDQEILDLIMADAA